MERSPTETKIETQRKEANQHGQYEELAFSGGRSQSGKDFALATRMRWIAAQQ